jgi:methylmalonyl-CoA/ethylmalonyl-CoA epimerase
MVSDPSKKMNTVPEIALDHIGIAVEGLDQAYSFWETLGWSTGTLAEETVPTQKVRVGFLPLQNKANIELLESTDNTGPISKFIEKRGAGVHHICFRVKNIDQMLKSLKEKGVRLINESAVPGAHGCRVAFIHPSSTGGVLIELSEPPKGAN